MASFRIHAFGGRWLFLSLIVVAHAATAAQNQAPQGGPNNLPAMAQPPVLQTQQPQAAPNNIQPSTPLNPQVRPALESPAMPSGFNGESGRAPLDDAYLAAQGKLVDQAIPIEDLIIAILGRMEDDAEADLDDMLDEMASNREERAELRAKRQQAHERAQEAERHRRMEQEAKRRAAREARRDARHAARDAREERREALREARASERHKRWAAREKARMERQARRAQRQAERREAQEAREARREAAETRRRKSHLVHSLVSALVDQFNALEGPLGARVASILDQIDTQAAALKPPSGSSDDDGKHARDLDVLGQQLNALRQLWAEFVAATGSGVRCTSCN